MVQELDGEERRLRQALERELERGPRSRSRRLPRPRDITDAIAPEQREALMRTRRPFMPSRQSRQDVPDVLYAPTFRTTRFWGRR